MESPVLQSSVETEMERKHNMFLALAIVFFIFAVGFLIIIVFTYGKTNTKSPAPTFNDQEPVVSAPAIAVGEPNSSMPATPSTTKGLTTYTYEPDHGFNFQYDSSAWEITTEPQQITEYIDANNLAPTNNVLTLRSKIAPGEKIEFLFSKATSANINAHGLSECEGGSKILIDQGAIGGDGVTTYPKGLIRFDQQDNGTIIYASSYYINAEDNSQYCIRQSHPIYILESVPGGTQQDAIGLDNNDIYWIVTIYTGKRNTQLEAIDEIVKTVKFAQ